jgi:localization factor PodJL
MNRAAAWSVRGVGRETREIAEEAARRAGMSLGDWLDEVVAEQAAEQGVSAEDWDEDGKLDAIGERLSRLSRQERSRQPRRDADEEARGSRRERKFAAERPRRLLETEDDSVEDARGSRRERKPAAEQPRLAHGRPEDEDDSDDDELEAIGERLSRLSARGPAKRANRPAVGEEARPRPEPKPSGEEARRAHELLDAAIAKFETRAAQTEHRTAKALESVASWIENSQADRVQERETLKSVADKLTAIEQRAVSQADRPPADSVRSAPRAEEAALESRLTRTEERTAKALESVASWIENSQAARAEERETLKSVAQRLHSIEQAAGRRVDPPPAEPA